MKQPKSLGHRRALAKLRRIQDRACSTCGSTEHQKRERMNHVRYWAAQAWLSVIDQHDEAGKRHAVEQAVMDAVDAAERAYQQAIRHVIPDEWTRNEIIRSAVSSDTSAAVDRKAANERRVKG